jgi:hypothetical protein
MEYTEMIEETQPGLPHVHTTILIEKTVWLMLGFVAKSGIGVFVLVYERGA